MSISVKTHKTLWGRAANRCSICRCELVFGATETDDESLVGDACHIVAQKTTGPRGESTLTPEQRNKYVNLILLCKNHHKLVDDQVNQYGVDRLREIKNEHEKWVRESLQDYDAARQRDDEIYAGYVEEWAKYADLENWLAWSSWVLSAGQPSLSAEQHKALKDLRRWLFSRVWPKRYGALEASLENFRRVLDDFYEVFSKHAVKWRDDTSITEKFYKTQHWNEEQYAELLRQYNFHVDLTQDLMLELTRAANYVCDRVREFLFPAYRLDEGVLVVETGMGMNLKYAMIRAEYCGEERVQFPYPGLDQFLVDRANRDVNFGIGINADDPSFTEHYSKPPFDS
jgi:hypothetical protein